MASPYFSGMQIVFLSHGHRITDLKQVPLRCRQIGVP